MTEIYIPATPLIIAKDKYNSANYYANNIKNEIITKEGAVIKPFNDLNLYGGKADKQDIEIFYKNKSPNIDISYNEIAFLDSSLIYTMMVGKYDMKIEKSNLVLISGGGGGGLKNGNSASYFPLDSDIYLIANSNYTITIGKGGSGTLFQNNDGEHTIFRGDIKVNDKTIYKNFPLINYGALGGNNNYNNNIRTGGYTFNSKVYGYGGDKFTFNNGLKFWVSEGYVDPDPDLNKNQRWGFVTNITDNANPLYDIFRPLQCRYYWWYPYWTYPCVNGNRPFSIFFKGYFYARTAGYYLFLTASDDDSWTYIDFLDKNMTYSGKGNFYDRSYFNNKYGRMVANNGGLHGNQFSSYVGPEQSVNGLPAGSIKLEANTVYKITMIFKQNYGGANFTAWFRPPEGYWITDGTGYYYSDLEGTNSITSLSKSKGSDGLVYLKYTINKSLETSVNNVDIQKQITQNFGSDALVVKPLNDIPAISNKEAKQLFIKELKKKCMIDNANNGISTQDCDKINTNFLENFANADLLTKNDPNTGDIVNMYNELDNNSSTNNYNYYKTNILYYKSQMGVITLYKLTLMTLLLNEIYYNIKVALGTFLGTATNSIQYPILNSIVLNFNSTTAGVGTFAYANNKADIVINLKNNYDYLFFKNNGTTGNAIVDSTTTAVTATPNYTNIANPTPYTYTFNYFSHGFYNFDMLKKNAFASFDKTESYGYKLNKQFYNYLMYKLYYLFNVKDSLLTAQILNLYHTTNILIYKLKIYYAINIYTGTVTDITLNRIKDKLEHYITKKGTGNLISNGINLNRYGTAVSNSYQIPAIDMTNLKKQYTKTNTIIDAKASTINDSRTKLNSVINQYNNDKNNISKYTLFSYVLYIIIIFLLLVFAVIIMTQSISNGSKIIYSSLIFIVILFMLVITYIYYGNSSSTIEKFTSISATNNGGKSYLYDIFPIINNSSAYTNNYNLWDFKSFDNSYYLNKLSTGSTADVSNASSTNAMADSSTPAYDSIRKTTTPISTNDLIVGASTTAISTLKGFKLNNLDGISGVVSESSSDNTNYSSILYNYTINTLTNSSVLFIVREKYLSDIFILDNGTPSSISGTVYENTTNNIYNSVTLTGSSPTAVLIVSQFSNQYTDDTGFELLHSGTSENKLSTFLDNFNKLVTSYLFNLQLNLSYLDTIELYQKTNNALEIKKKNVDNYFKIYQNKQSMVSTNQNLLKYDMLFKYNLNNSLCYIFLLSIIIYIIYLMNPSLSNILLIIWIILLIVIILIFLMSITFPVRTKTSKSYWLRPSKDTIQQL